MPTTREATLLRKLTDQVRFYDPGAAPTYDEATHTAVVADGATLWSGPALFQTAASNRQVVDGAEVRQVAEMVVRVPVDALEHLAEGCIAQRDADGLRVQVIRVPARTNQTTARIECKAWSGHINRVRSTP